MDYQRNRYKAKISDKTYTIIGNESKEHMDIVTELVNRQLQEILNLSDQTSPEQAAILLAINTVSDQVKKQEKILELEEDCKQMKQQVAELSEKMKNYQELQTRLKRVEEMEQKAKEVLSENGTEPGDLSPNEAQHILNQQVKQRIKQNYQDKSES